MNKVPTSNLGLKPQGQKEQADGTVKEIILGELEQLGSGHLHQWALENPTEFYKIAARLIPAAREISGREGGPIEYQTIREYSTEELYRMIED